MFWDITQALVLIYLAVDIPMRVGLNWEASGPTYILSFAIEVYFWVDLIVNFFSAFETADGIVVQNLAEIRLNYLRTWFLVDFVSCAPIDLGQRISDSTFMCSLRGDCVQVGDQDAQIAHQGLTTLSSGSIITPNRRTHYSE
jgi:hypothetical protein